MKKETEELLDKITGFLPCSGKFSPEDYLIWNEFRNKILRYESDVKHGGFIQDRKGNICRNGDVIKLNVGVFGFEGRLIWDEKESAFKVNIANMGPVFLWCFKGNWEKKEL